MHRILAEINKVCRCIYINNYNLTLIGYYPHYVNSSPLNWKQYRFVSEETKQKGKNVRWLKNLKIKLWAFGYRSTAFDG